MSDVKATAENEGSDNSGLVIGLCLVFSLIASVFVGLDHIPSGIGFVKKSIYMVMVVVAGVPGGVLGGLLGEAIRKFTHPDAILTHGLLDTLWKKVFWAIGPQAIGLFLGAGAGCMAANWLFCKIFV